MKQSKQLRIGKLADLDAEEMLHHCFDRIGLEFKFRLANSVDIQVDSPLHIDVEVIVLPQNGLFLQPLLHFLFEKHQLG